jgi:hypothetical protein
MAMPVELLVFGKLQNSAMKPTLHDKKSGETQESKNFENIFNIYLTNLWVGSLLTSSGA